MNAIICRQSGARLADPTCDGSNTRLYLIKAALLLAIAGGGYHYWQGHAAKADLHAATSPSGWPAEPNKGMPM